MPAYRGVNIFGTQVVMTVRDTPVQRQENAYCGLAGVESIALGGRGRYVEVQGLLWGAATGADLTALDNAIRAYQDGLAGVLVDNTGYSWPYAILETFDPDPRIKFDRFLGYHHKYSARFRLLI